MALINQFLEAQREYQRELLSKKGVVGVGIGYRNGDRGEADELALVAMVEQKMPMAAMSEADKVPAEVAGVKTDVMEVGLIRAQANSNSRDHWRPTIPGGVSIAHHMITAGTYGVMVYDSNGTAYILSNNHVLANSNDAFVNDPILQPGPTDGGANPADVVAVLNRYAKLSYVDENVVGDANPIIGGSPTTPSPDPDPTTPPTTTPPTTTPSSGNDGCAAFIVSFADTLAKAQDPDAQVQLTRASAVSQSYDPYEATSVQAQAAIPENQLDAALALPTDARMFQREILQIGGISGTMPVSIGMAVRKHGRTTAYTEGTVTLINATVDVGYRTAAGSKTARFVGQVMSTAMSQGGDSGSLIVDKNSQNAVGLLFAGSTSATIFTPIDRVLQKFGVKITL